jgi:hypothetical protein
MTLAAPLRLAQTKHKEASNANARRTAISVCALPSLGQDFIERVISGVNGHDFEETRSQEPTE